VNPRRKGTGDKALKQEKEEVLEKIQVAQKEKDEIRPKFKKNNVKIQEENYELLAEQTVVKEAVTKALRSMSGLEQDELELTEMQVGNLVEAIMQLQAWIMELELQAVPRTLHEVHIVAYVQFFPNCHLSMYLIAT
jgi:phosphopantetheinyl transferase (holo-ACP synthase)